MKVSPSSCLLGWLVLLLAAGVATADNRPLQRVYVHPQEVAVEPTTGGVLLGMCLDKGVIGAPRDCDPIAHWSHPRDVLVVKRKRDTDNPFNPKLGPPTETTLEDVLKKPAAEREIEFVGAVDTSEGVNLRARLTAKADRAAVYVVVVKLAVAASRKEEGMPAEVVRWVEESRKTLADVEKLLADVRKHLPGSPFDKLLRGYAQEKVYWPLGKTGQVADGAAAVKAFVNEVGAVVAAVPEERRAAVARLLYGDTDHEEVGRLVAGFGAKVPDTRMTPGQRKVLNIARERLAAYARTDARLYAVARAPKTAAQLPHLLLARRFADLVHNREANRLPLGDGDALAITDALQVLAATPAAVSMADGKTEITHPALKGAKLSPTAYAERVAAAVAHLKKPDTMDAVIVRVIGLCEKLEEKPSVEEAVAELTALLDTARWMLLRTRGDSDLALAGLVGTGGSVSQLIGIDAERDDYLKRTAVSLVALPEALKRAGLQVPEDLRPFSAGPEVPAEWLLALACARSLADAHAAQPSSEPLLFDISGLSADQWRAFARDALPVFEQRAGGAQLLRATDAATVERAASLRFGPQLMVLAHDGLKSLESVKVAGQGFPVGELCLDMMTRFEKAYESTATRDRVRFRFAQAENGEGLLKEWTDAAEAGDFAGKVVVLTLCPQEVSGKKIDRLVATLLDPKKGKAAAVVVPTDATDMRHFAFAAFQSATHDFHRAYAPREILDKGFEMDLHALARSRSANDRMSELERWFPWSEEVMVDYLMEVVKDEKKYDEYVRQHQKHRQRFVVLP